MDLVGFLDPRRTTQKRQEHRCEQGQKKAVGNREHCRSTEPRSTSGSGQQLPSGLRSDCWIMPTCNRSWRLMKCIPPGAHNRQTDRIYKAKECMKMHVLWEVRTDQHRWRPREENHPTRTGKIWTRRDTQGMTRSLSQPKTRRSGEGEGSSVGCKQNKTLASCQTTSEF